MKKKAVIVSCFDWYDQRLYHLHHKLIELGYEVTLLTSDFDHIKKSIITDRRKNISYVPVPRYKRNISAARFFSHFCFSAAAYRSIKKIRPDLVYALIPPNSVCVFLNKYKRKHPDSRLVYDVIDMWPESFPVAFLRKTPLFAIWKKPRTEGFNLADYIVAECDYYLSEIKPENLGKCKVLKLFKGITNEHRNEVLKSLDNYSSGINKGTITLCYLGSINNIIDLDSIKTVVSALLSDQYRIVFHIIGDGSSRDQFVEMLTALGCEVEYHGKVFDEKVKRQILGKCDFGINMMRRNIKVGLTLKSIDYLNNGLPIINNIPGDTWSFVDNNGVGINFDGDTEQLVNNISKTDIKALKKQAFECYEENFSKDVFENNFNDLIDLFVQ